MWKLFFVPPLLAPLTDESSHLRRCIIPTKREVQMEWSETLSPHARVATWRDRHANLCPTEIIYLQCSNTVPCPNPGLLVVLYSEAHVSRTPLEGFRSVSVYNVAATVKISASVNIRCLGLKLELVVDAMA